MTSSADGLPHRTRSIKDRLKDGLSSWQTKSRSVDQSLAAAFDVDVIGGLSRLAGSALGGSTDGGGGGAGRPSSPLGGGERRSSGSGGGVGSSGVGSGSVGRLTEDTLAYTVQNSDTLTSLAARFDTTPSELVAINKLHSRLIFPGQVLQVPRKDGHSGAGGGDGSSEGSTTWSASDLGPLNVSIHSSSSNSNINEVFGRRDSNGPTSPAERPIEHAFLDSLRPPGSPRFNRADFAGGNGGSALGVGGAAATAAAQLEANLQREAMINEQLMARTDVTQADVDAERARDRSAYEKFLKINVRHVTDGQGVVAGVLLVTPNTVMFDPNVSDALVIERGAEAYGVIAPMEFVVNAALYPDIAHMRLAESMDGLPDQPISDPIYFPADCPLHRKYAILKDKLENVGQQCQQLPPTDPTPSAAAAAANDLDPTAGILAIAGDIQRRWSEGTSEEHDDELIANRTEGIPTPLPPVPLVAETHPVGHFPLVHPQIAGVISSTTQRLSQIKAVGEVSHVLPTIPDVVCSIETGGDEDSSVINVEDSSLVASSDNGSTIAAVNQRLLSSSMDKTPSADREDELCFSEELNVTDEDDKDEAFHSSSGSTYEQVISDAMMDESGAGSGSSSGDNRGRVSNTGASSTSSFPPQSGAARSRAMPPGAYRQQQQPQPQPRQRPISSDPTTVGRNQHSPAPPPSSSSPESRGHRMLKRLSYPLVWMGESLSLDSNSKEGSPVLTNENNGESVFSKVFSSTEMPHNAFVSAGSSFVTADDSQTSQTTEEDESWQDGERETNSNPPLPSHAQSLLLLVNATTGESDVDLVVDGRRRLSTENSRGLVPNLFRTSSGGKEPHQHHHHQYQPQQQQQSTTAPKLGYRSMVSVDDVPELFASLDKLIPKPAQACDAPPLYLRLRMGKPLNRKGAMTTPIMSYGKKNKMKPEYWFSIPRDKADILCRFFLLWSPQVYGELGDSEAVARRGFELITSDLEWEEPSPQHQRRLKPAKKSRGRKDDAAAVAAAADEDDDDDPLGATAELAKESWEIVSLNEEVRRALYGTDRLSTLDLDSYLPDLIGPTEVLTDDVRKQLVKHLPARVEGYPWSLVFSTSQNGFSLSSLYRKMFGIDSPILLIIEDTQGNVFGAVTSCEIRVSESFYGTGESFLFAMNPKLQIYSWTGENSYFIQGNNESLAIGAGDGRFGLWLDGDLNQGRTQTCKTFGNEPLSPDEDFWVKTLECWAFM